jgi:TPR repeat protein
LYNGEFSGQALNTIDQKYLEKIHYPVIGRHGLKQFNQKELFIVSDMHYKEHKDGVCVDVYYKALDKDHYAILSKKYTTKYWNDLKEYCSFNNMSYFKNNHMLHSKFFYRYEASVVMEAINNAGHYRRDMLEKAAKIGNVDAQYELAKIYFDLNPNHSIGMKWLSMACDGASLGALDSMIQRVKNQPNQFFIYTKRKALLGEHSDQCNLGVMLLYGRGCQKDEKEALDWILKAVKQNHAPAQWVLGYMLNEGRGCEEKDKEELFWY